MRIIIGNLTSFIFLILSLVHVYWAFGGKWGQSGAIPTRAGKSLLQPGVFGTLLVALALLLASFFMLSGSGMFTFNNRFHFINNSGILTVAVLFLLRAIGDFKYIGFFKKYRETPFAFWDTRLHSPLCLFISASAFYLGFAN
ncbi:MAG: DUF3995 domain-containing protein [Calditrichaeota bacterium]|nr:MAG: DUF3995 domain-containing protein [Calditrichota bacterium]